MMSALLEALLLQIHNTRIKPWWQRKNKLREGIRKDNLSVTEKLEKPFH